MVVRSVLSSSYGYTGTILRRDIPFIGLGALVTTRKKGGAEMILLSGKYKDIMVLLGSATREGYGNLPAVWAIKLWMVRN